MKAPPMSTISGGQNCRHGTRLLEKANRRRLRNIGSHFGKHAVAGQFSQFLNVETSIAHSNDWAAYRLPRKGSNQAAPSSLAAHQRLILKPHK
jgi:hypothetical protein